MHPLEGGDKIADALELAVDGSEPHVGHFAEIFQLLQHQLSDLLASDVPITPLLEDRFQVVNDRFKALC